MEKELDLGQGKKYRISLKYLWCHQVRKCSKGSQDMPKGTGASGKVFALAKLDFVAESKHSTGRD